MTRVLWAFQIGSLVALIVAIGLSTRDAQAHAVAGRVSIAYPLSGTITTLECYDGPSFAPCIGGDPNGDGVTGPHAGTWNSRIDVGGATGVMAWAQVDYLPDGAVTGVSGGYAIAYRIGGYCSQWDPGNSNYNGKLVQIDLLYYDTAGYLINGNSLLFQHIAPGSKVGTSGALATWYHWNNPNNSIKLWTSWVQDFLFDNGPSGGMDIGTVASFVPGDPPPQCAGAPHLHLENSAGEYNPLDYLGRSVVGRQSYAQYMHLAGINGTAPY